YELIGFLRGHLVDVLAQLVHALNFMQKAISHCRRPFYDFAVYVGIFLASYITFLPFILSTSARIFSVVSNTWPHLIEQFKAGLIENGLIERQNITIDYRSAERDIERIRQQAGAHRLARRSRVSPRELCSRRSGPLSVHAASSHHRRRFRLIPNPIDQNPWAHWRSPMDMMRQG